MLRQLVSLAPRRLLVRVAAKVIDFRLWHKADMPLSITHLLVP
jgi:hypothetical protein